MKTHFEFEDKQRVGTIELDELKLTKSVFDYGGKVSHSRPLKHFELIDRTLELCDKANLNPVLEPIWISKSDSKTISELYKADPGILGSWIFERLLTRISLNSITSDENYHASIGIGYNTHGLTLAWGTNVRVCQNMSIFGQNLMTTYGPNKMPFDKIMEVFSKWLGEGAEKFNADKTTFKLMSGIQVDSNGMDKCIGKLHQLAVKQAYIDTKIDAPLNISQVSNFSKEYLTNYKSLDKPLTVYDVYNAGTAILSPNKSEIENLWQNNLSFGNFIVNEYLN